MVCHHSCPCRQHGPRPGVQHPGAALIAPPPVLLRRRPPLPPKTSGRLGRGMQLALQTDPEAAKVVFEAGVPLVMVPLEVSGDALRL